MGVKTVQVSYKKVRLATVVEGDPKAPFSIATTPRYWGRCYSLPWIAPLYPEPCLLMLSVKQGSIKYHFLSLWYNSPRSSGPVANTLLIRLIVHQYIYMYTYIYCNIPRSNLQKAFTPPHKHTYISIGHLGWCNG